MKNATTALIAVQVALGDTVDESAFDAGGVVAVKTAAAALVAADASLEAARREVAAADVALQGMQASHLRLRLCLIVCRVRLLATQGAMRSSKSRKRLRI